jgi:hypothetical protein
MAFEKFIPFRSNGNDASLDIISRFARIQRKGFVSAWQDAQNVVTERPGPIITPVSAVLFVDVEPDLGPSPFVGWVAISDDGMVIRERTQTYRVAVTASTKNYICLRAKYNSSPGGEIVDIVVLTQSAYTASAIKSELIIIGTLTLGATTDATTGTLSYDERDRVEGFFDTNWLPSVDTFASLPTIVTNPFLSTRPPASTRWPRANTDGLNTALVYILAQ